MTLHRFRINLTELFSVSSVTGEFIDGKIFSQFCKSISKSNAGKMNY